MLQLDMDRRFSPEARFDFDDESFVSLQKEIVENSVSRISLSDLPDLKPKGPLPTLKSSPILERLFRIAQCDVEDNIVRDGDDLYLGAGSEFGPRVYTRDIAFSGILGLNKLYPELMDASLRYTRKVRRKVGFKIPREESQVDAAIPWEPVDLNGDEFLLRYRTNAFRNRTDDVCWLWALGDLYGSVPEVADWRFLYEEGLYCFETYYDRFFDPIDGLYRGQATFVDIGYPPPLGTGYDESLSVYERIQIKVISTNCLYLFGMRAMEKAAALLMNDQCADKWRGKADALSKAIVKTFLKPNGKLAYYKRPDGTLEQRSDAMGTALAILSGVIAGEDAIAAIEDYPINDAGVPLFDPFFPTERWYHNHSSWPFADAFFLRARSVATGVDERPLIAALMALSCVDDGRFHEVRDYRSKKVGGSSKQLWTAAAFLGLF